MKLKLVILTLGLLGSAAAQALTFKSIYQCSGHNNDSTLQIKIIEVVARIPSVIVDVGLKDKGKKESFITHQELYRGHDSGVYSLWNNQGEEATLIFKQVKKACGRGSCDLGTPVKAVAALEFQNQSLEFNCYDSNQVN